MCIRDRYDVTLTAHYEKTISVCAESAEQAKAKTEIILFDTDLINLSLIHILLRQAIFLKWHSGKSLRLSEMCQLRRKVKIAPLRRNLKHAMM